MSNVIDHFKNNIIQIASPYGSGTGFFNKDYRVFITNFHVIKDNEEVIISSRSFKKRLAKVLFFDPYYDLAFIEAPEDIQMEHAVLSDVSVHDGDSITAIGHPYGLKYTATKGIVSKDNRNYNEIGYIQIDAAINPGNSGGPLINENGEVVGVNTFIISQGESLGFSLPVKYLKESLEEFSQLNRQKSIRCKFCKKILTEAMIDGSYCSNCGASIDLNDFKPKPYIPAGAAFKVEQVIEKLGMSVKETRVGTNIWELEKGTARIKILYNTENHFIVADAWLCNLPKDNIMNAYEYLLKENYTNEGLVFSLNNQAILLSFVSYEDDVTIESGSELLKNLLLKADYYDNILIDNFKCQPRLEEE